MVDPKETPVPAMTVITQEDIAKMVGEMHISLFLSTQKIAELERENRELKEKIKKLDPSSTRATAQ